MSENAIYTIITIIAFLLVGVVAVYNAMDKEYRELFSAGLGCILLFLVLITATLATIAGFVYLMKWILV